MDRFSQQQRLRVGFVRLGRGNSLLRHLRDPIHTSSAFARLLETCPFSEYSKRIKGCFSA